MDFQFQPWIDSPNCPWSHQILRFSHSQSFLLLPSQNFQSAVHRINFSWRRRNKWGWVMVVNPLLPFLAFFVLHFIIWFCAFFCVEKSGEEWTTIGIKMRRFFRAMCDPQMNWMPSFPNKEFYWCLFHWFCIIKLCRIVANYRKFQHPIFHKFQCIYKWVQVRVLSNPKMPKGI